VGEGEKQRVGYRRREGLSAWVEGKESERERESKCMSRRKRESERVSTWVEGRGREGVSEWVGGREREAE